MKTMLACFALVVIGFYLGRIAAHVEIATECERLGKFFVKKRVYVCNHWFDVTDAKTAPQAIGEAP